MITKSVACWYSLNSVNSPADLLGVENDRENTDAIKENFVVTCPQHPNVNIEESLKVGHGSRLEIMNPRLISVKVNGKHLSTVLSGRMQLPILCGNGDEVSVPVKASSVKDSEEPKRMKR